MPDTHVAEAHSVSFKGETAIVKNFRVNERIRAREVRLIGDNGENTLMFTGDALALARQRGEDLVEVAPNEVPPVCKLMDYGKFRYEQTKKERDSRKTQKQIIVKEVRFSPKIDEHDIDYRTTMVKKFLDEGNKVKLTVKFKGRELAHPNLGRDVLDQVRLSLGDHVVIEAPPKMEGKNMTMLVSLKPQKSAPAPRPQQNGAAKPATTAPVAAPAAAPGPAAEPVPVTASAPAESPAEAPEPVAAGAEVTGSK